MDWYEAVDYCESNFDNSFLADILNQETQDFINDSEFIQTYPSVSYWIGGSDITRVSVILVCSRAIRQITYTIGMARHVKRDENQLCTVKLPVVDWSTIQFLTLLAKSHST